MNFSQFLLIELTRYKYPDFVSLLFSEKSLFIREVKESGLFNLPEYPVVVPGIFWKTLENNKNLIYVLRKIADFKNEEHSISEPFNFSHYFTLTIQEDHINNEEFNQAITQNLEQWKNKLKYWQKTNPDMLIYKFRNYESFNIIDDFMIYIDKLIFVSDYIKDEERFDILPRILVDKYIKLTDSDNIDSRVFYEKVANRILGEASDVSDVIKNVFRNNTSYKVKGEYTDSPGEHGWKANNDITNYSDLFVPGVDDKNGTYIVFEAPFDVLFEYEFTHAPSFLRNVRCYFMLFEFEDGAFYVKVQIKKGGDVRTLFIKPMEQPARGLGRISENEYAIGLGVKIEKNWRQFEFNIDQVFRVSDFARDGYILIAATGIAIRGKVGFGNFELY